MHVRGNLVEDNFCMSADKQMHVKILNCAITLVTGVTLGFIQQMNDICYKFTWNYFVAMDPL